MKRDDFEMRFQPARTEQGRSLPDNRGEPPGNSWWGVCRPVFQIRPKNVIFITRFQTWTLKFIPFCTPGKGRNYAVIPKIRTSSLKKISWNPFLIRILIAFLLIHLQLNRQIRTFIHSRSSLKNHTRFQTKMEKVYTCFQTSLRSRRLEVAGERENGRARGRHASPSRAPVFTCAHYFQGFQFRKMNKLPCKWKVDFGIHFEIQSIFALFLLLWRCHSYRLKELHSVIFCLTLGAIVAI